MPSVYSAALSEFVFASGVALMKRDRPDIMYLSTTDYVQHKAAPGTAAANDFTAMLDGYLAQLDALGATVVLTADHGMNAKTDAFGRPEHHLPAGPPGRVVRQGDDARDPAHHRSRTSSITARSAPMPPCIWDRDPRGTTRSATSRRLPGVEGVYTREQACAKFELPPDRVGDLVIVSERLTVIGTSRDRHDLSGPRRAAALARRHVRTARAADRQPQPAGDLPQRRWRNFDAFDLGLNHLQ